MIKNEFLTGVEKQEAPAHEDPLLTTGPEDND